MRVYRLTTTSMQAVCTGTSIYSITVYSPRAIKLPKLLVWRCLCKKGEGGGGVEASIFEKETVGDRGTLCT
jgi:hypothetical protein